MKTDTLPHLITRTEASTILHCHPATLRRWEIAGRLMPVKISTTKVLYARSDIEHLVKEAMADRLHKS